jgi:hypothetical protein
MKINMFMILLLGGGDRIIINKKRNLKIFKYFNFRFKLKYSLINIF